MITIISLWSFLFLLNVYVTQCAQPYFPPQITFTFADRWGPMTFAIDEFNQRAYRLFDHGQGDYAYVMKNFPFPIPDSPQSKYYVQLTATYPPLVSCRYGAFWKYGAFDDKYFPSHWYYNSSSFRIENYIKFNYKMIHSDDESILEDYWYSDEKCSVISGERYPCEEIYFTKNTDIPLKTVRINNFQDRVQTEYKVLSIGKPDEKLFEPIPLDWAYKCKDIALGAVLNATYLELKVNESATIEIYLSAPPHRINGNDTVIIEYKPSTYSVCRNCVRSTPKRLIFNSGNFRHPQKLIVTRIKDSDTIWLEPTFTGGAYEQVMASIYSIRIY